MPAEDGEGVTSLEGELVRSERGVEPIRRDDVQLRLHPSAPTPLHTLSYSLTCLVFCETADSCVWQDELQRRYRMMEADRKLYADEVQNVVRKQKSQIEKLKRENAQLRYGSCTATSLHPSSSPPPSTPYTLAPQPSSSTIRPRPQVGAAAAAARLDRRRRLGGLCQGDAHAGLNRSDHSGD